MIKRVRCHFSGVVQGVGFRPFIYRIARLHALTGFVQNRPDGVVAEVEGTDPSIDAFLSDVRNHLPPLSDVTSLVTGEAPVQDDKEFRIIASEVDGAADLHITPDVAICSECLQELFDPTDRRYRYPFINCTNCGPRMTIINAIPYDRINTSMACFPLCPECLKEYQNPEDRRFHAEPTACPVCGPRLILLDEKGRHLDSPDPLQTAGDKLLSGAIVAIKGLGGFHLCVDAGNDKAVKRLRSRKYREEKPLAIMVKDSEYAARITHLSDAERALLESYQSPIVLLAKRKGTPVSEGIAPGMGTLGIMLPYTPIQHLLFERGFTALVMTSANQTDEPICIGNREAVTRLKDIADFFLVHNRDILVRCDDSIAMVAADEPVLLRRSRGYAPKPLMLRDTYPEILALGPQLKTTICILKDRMAFLSPHIGDLETPQARDFLHENTNLMYHIAQCHPRRVACDLHPGYYTTQVARKMEDAEEIIAVQHHHAHIVSCMAEHGITGQVIGLSMDGTGYGSDSHAWGGEFLVAHEADFTRRGHLSYYLLPGGEKSIHEPWRIAVTLLKEAFKDDWPCYARKLHIVPEERYYDLMDTIMGNRINSPLTSSLGRLFDGVAVIVGLRHTVFFEGQAAMELEAIAKKQTTLSLPFDITEEGKSLLLDFSPAIRRIVELLLAGESKESLSWTFHRCLCEAFREMAVRIREETGLNRTVLSGGCFQNRILLEGCLQELRDAGFDVFTHRLVPTNDGGISLGQAVCAGARVKAGLSSPGRGV
ncbi:MAG TPA: carbamoyltransferase HypF [Syntrophales bacterium]|nr:carbamoyltransferase HypF [Syntrophales bacterium]